MSMSIEIIIGLLVGCGLTECPTVKECVFIHNYDCSNFVDAHTHVRTCTQYVHACPYTIIEVMFG